MLWETRLHNRLAPQGVDQEPSVEQFWRTGWQPQDVTVTFIAWAQKKGETVPLLQPQVLRPDDQVTFDLQDGAINISLGEETFDRLARTSIEGLGLTYVSLAELRARRASAKG